MGTTRTTQPVSRTGAGLLPIAVGLMMTLNTSLGHTETEMASLDIAPTSSLDYRRILQCGPNALFLFLLLSGRNDVDFDRVQEIQVSAHGVSLTALRDAAKRFGLNTEIRQYPIERIDSVPLPAIGHFISGMSSVTSNHFDVIYKVDSEGVFLLNGTTGDLKWLRRSNLANFWSGFVLIEKRSGVGRAVMAQWHMILAIAVALPLEFWLCNMWLRRRRRCRQSRSIVICERGAK